MTIELSKILPLGRKSLVTELSILNYESPKHPYKVKVHANKNHGICDLVLCKEASKEVEIEITGPDGKKRSKKKLKTFYKPIRRLTEIFSEFQGRQYDDENTMTHLTNVLTQILNSNEKELL